MARLLPLLVLIAVAVMAMLWLAQRLGTGRTALPGEPGEGELAVLAHGPETGTGHLRATASQLIFTAATGRVLVLERMDITGVTLTRDLPERTTASPLLAVSTREDVYYFQVDDPREWIARLI